MKYKLMSAIMAFSMLVSSTIAPLAASKSYASAEIEENPTVMNEKTDEVGNDEKPAETSDTKLDIPEKTEEVKEQSPAEIKVKEQEPEIRVEKEEDTIDTAIEETDTEEIEEKEKIIDKSVDVDLYEDSSYDTLSNEAIDIKITGKMPENGTIKAYEIQNAVTDMEKENVLAFGFEIFDKDDNLYYKNPTDQYKVEIKSSKLRNLDKIYLYEKNENDIRFAQTTDFSKLSDQVKLESKAEEFAIAKYLEKEEEETPKEQTKDEEVKSPFLTNEDKKEVAEKEIEKPKDILDSLENSVEEKQTTETSSEKATEEENTEDEKPSADTELVDWKKDLLDALTSNLEDIQAEEEKNSEETIKEDKESEEILDSEEEIKEESVKESEDPTLDSQINDEKEENSEVKTDTTTEDSVKNEDLDKQASEEDIEKSETNEETEDSKETEEKLTYQQVLADIYTDSSYSQKSNDQTRIKLSGRLPGFTKVKAYPVEIEIEGKEILAAYDITIFDENDEEYKVTEKNDINVQITNQKIKEAKEVEVYHKKSEFTPEEKVDIENKNRDTVSFKAESFSIYAVTEDDKNTVTVVFVNKNYENEKEPIREIWDIQTLRDGEYVKQPELPIFSYKGKFIGWYYYKYEDSIAAGKDIFGEKFDFNQPIKVDELRNKFKDGIIYLKGQYKDVIYVDFIDKKEYKDNDGTIKYQDEVVTTSEVSVGNKIPADEISRELGEPGFVFSHWSLTPNGAPYPINDPISKTSDGVTKKGYYTELKLYAVYKKAYTVTFDSDGGTPVTKLVVNEGETAKFGDHTKPTKVGYKFDYWLDESGNKFDENTAITRNRRLKAKYTPLASEFTINHWVQNANDDGYTLELDRIEPGQTGTQTGIPSSYKLSDQEMKNRDIMYVKSDIESENLPKIIRGDKSTTINLYYNRKTYTYRVYRDPTDAEKSRGIRSSIDVVNKTLKHGQDTSKYYDEAKKKLAELNQGEYNLKIGGLTGETVPRDKPMPKGDLTIYAYNVSTVKPTWYLKIYDIDTGKLLKTIPKYTDTVITQTYSQKNDYPGYEFQYFEKPGTNSARPSKNSHGINNETTANYEVWAYYKKGKYTLSYFIGNSQSSAYYYDIEYGKPLLNYPPPNYIAGKTVINNKTFRGWYDNMSGAGRSIDISTDTMPDKDLTLYAKWDSQTHTVVAYKERNNPAAGIIKKEIDHGEILNRDDFKIEKPPALQGRDDVFLKWYAFINGQFAEYTFSSPVTSEVYLYPVWVARDPENPNEFRQLSTIHKVTYTAWLSDGTPHSYTDKNDYVDNAEAIVLAPYTDRKYQFPDGKEIQMGKDQVFQGWQIDPEISGPKITEDMLNKIYQPGDIITVIDDIVFEPVVSKFPPTHLKLVEKRPVKLSGNDGERIIEGRNFATKPPIPINAEDYGFRDHRDLENQHLRDNDIVELPGPEVDENKKLMIANEGYTFKGWYRESDLNKPDAMPFQPGDNIMLTSDGEENILYGIWEEKTFNLNVRNIINGNLLYGDETVKLTIEYTDTLGEIQSKEYELKNADSIDNITVPYSGFKITTESSSPMSKTTYQAQVLDENGDKIGTDSGNDIYDKVPVNTNIDVTFTTTITIPPPTGLIDNFTPMAIMLGLASMAFAYRLYKRNKLAGGIDEWIRKSWRFFKQG